MMCGGIYRTNRVNSLPVYSAECVSKTLCILSMIYSLYNALRITNWPTSRGMTVKQLFVSFIYHELGSMKP